MFRDFGFLHHGTGWPGLFAQIRKGGRRRFGCLRKRNTFPIHVSCSLRSARIAFGLTLFSLDLGGLLNHCWRANSATQRPMICGVVLVPWGVCSGGTSPGGRAHRLRPYGFIERGSENQVAFLDLNWFVPMTPDRGQVVFLNSDGLYQSRINRG
ncbi:hypothetical protein Enr10x_33500 [Gimesia panareensis]|uniref:Uncharacterized protein n=1 Tax=Gimesia panareensis TaxID=2527978 RepID=A0A517Q8U3_9PLAN|nr:hypothetical protein Enr10x_33500 [Gimesia panareensis]